MKYHLLFIALAAIVLPAMATAKPIPSNQLTSYGRTLFSEEINHGPQVSQTSLFSAAVTTDSEGQVLALNSLMGSPGKFSINDALTGKQIKALPLGENSAGSYSTIVHSSGDIYLSSHPHGHLYRYRTGRNGIEDLGSAPGVKFIWEMEEISNGKIVLACYPEAQVLIFDPATGEFQSMGSAAEGEDYARSVAYYAPENTIYIGVGSHPALIEWNLDTGEKRNILPSDGIDDSTVYNTDVIGDKIVIRLSPSKKGMVIDIPTKFVYDTLPLMDGNAVSSLAPDGESYFFTNGNKLMQHNLQTKQQSEVAEVAGNTRGMGFPEIDGQPHLVTISYGGTVDIINLATSESKTVKQELPKEPVDLHNLFLGPDNRLYSSGYVAGSLGIFDPATSEAKQIGGIAQAEAADYTGNVFIFGTYPRARITRYEVDPDKLVNEVPGENPRETFRLAEYHQDRPYGIHGMPETNIFAIGTIPDYGKHGGAVALYNDDEGTSRVFEDVVGKRGVVSFANTSNTLFTGTTISGGLGVKPVESEAVLVGMDLQTGEKLFEMTPVPNAHIISGLQLMPDGNIWGWADATLFILDPATQTVEHIHVIKEMGRRTGHLWRGARFTRPTEDGKCFAIVYGGIYHVNITERALHKVGEARGFSTLVHHQPTNSLFFARKENLVQWK